MNNYLKYYAGKNIHMEVAGSMHHEGILVDFGSDITVLHDGKQYFYIPMAHILHIRLSPNHVSELDSFSQHSPIGMGADMISYRKILENAKGLFVEIYVTGNQSVHGCIGDIFHDYILFNSPVHKTIIITIDHIKWLSLGNHNQTYYTLSKQHIRVYPSMISAAAPTFKEQLTKLKKNMVILDLGFDPNKIGILQKIENNFAELVTANEETVSFNLQHIKTVHLA